MLLLGAQQAPSLQIVEPADGATVPGPDVTVRLDVTGVELGGEDRRGAHVLLRMDRMPPVKSFADRFTFRALPTGPHRLRAELRRSDGSAFDPPVVDDVRFAIAERAGPEAPGR